MSRRMPQKLGLLLLDSVEMTYVHRPFHMHQSF